MKCNMSDLAGIPSAIDRYICGPCGVEGPLLIQLRGQKWIVRFLRQARIAM